MKDKLVFSFGRFNPPTTGHEVLLKKVVAVAKKENADAMVYSSQSNDPKKNPLPYKEKTKFMQSMFPKHKKVIQYDVGVKNAFDTLSTVYSKGYRDVTMVVGSDRVTEFANILNKYNDVEGKHGYYNFESGVKVVSAGARDPDAEGVTGMSASKMRLAAAANDFESFSKGMPAGFKGGQSVFDAVRKGMNLSEEMSAFLESGPEDLQEFYESISRKKLLKVLDKAGGRTQSDRVKDAAKAKSSRKKSDADLAAFRKKHNLGESAQNGLIGLDQIKKFESVVDKLFAKYNIDFNFTRHFGDRMDDSRNDPSITLKELAEFIKKMYKRQGKSIKGVAGAEAVLKDIQSDLNIPVAVTYDRNNDEFDVVLKTIMRKKNFTSPDKVIKYEENDMTNQLPEGFMDSLAERDYKKERKNYLGTPEQMERNAGRSRARRLAIKKGMAERGDGKDIHHKDKNPLNNDPKNLSSVTQKYNRSEPRKREVNEIAEFGQIPDMATLVAFAVAGRMSVQAVRAMWYTAKGMMKIKRWANKTGHKIATSAKTAPNYTQFESKRLDELSPKTKKAYSDKATRAAGNEKKYANSYSAASEADPNNPNYEKRSARHKRKLANRKKGIEKANEKYDINKSKEDRMNDKLLTMLHKMVTSKGKKESLGSYAFTVAKSFKDVSGRQLEKMYVKNYGVPESVLDERMFDRMFAGKAKKDDGTRSQADRTLKKYSPKKWAVELKRRQDAEKNGPVPVIKTQAHSHKKTDKGPKGVPHIHVADHNHKQFGG